ncbi:GNAT family N-acetyltransferase [Candidatus Acetothermia bacterium]|nr:GNAT family N-acetyltransferase [Candidatus Acetothermia bacterium]MBI3644280.1 GNAT family N-acetyltransferase [Candidatus Acetothermia bacterium]
MKHIIRDFQEGDYEACAAISNLVDPDHPTSVPEMRQRDRLRKSFHFYGRLVAVDRNSDEVVADATLGHGIFQYNKDVLFTRILVLPSHQRQGIGTGLYQRFERIWLESGVPRLRTEVSENQGPGLEFVKRLGFQEHHRVFESKLDVTNFDFASVQDPMLRLKSEEIVLTTLEDEIKNDPFVKAYPAVKRAYEICNHCAIDIPTPDPPNPLSLETFLALTIESPLALVSGLQLAKHEDRYVGVSILAQSPKENELLQRLTGVHREYRKRGIAFALKLQGIRFAQAQGARFIRTNNDTINTGMLAINRALGFVAEPSWINFEKSRDSISSR